MTALHEIWRRGVSPDIDSRYREIRVNLLTIQNHDWLPQTALRVLDVGYGSGAGSVVLKEMYPDAEIVCVDDASTQQRESSYKRRNLPLWADFTVIEDDIVNGDKEGIIGENDIVLASRFPLIWVPEKLSFRETNIQVAQRLLSIVKHVHTQGVLLIGYNFFEEGRQSNLDSLKARIDLNKLFGQVKLVKIPDYDEWLLLKDRCQNLPLPEDVLTEYGKEESFPFRGFNVDDIDY